MTNVEAGQIVRVRSRQYLVEDVVPKPSPTEDTLVRLSCLDDDALGEALEVLWEREVDAQYIGATSWESIANRGFDQPRLFSAYLHTLRWNCVTSTEPKLFQAPYRAGIEVKAYQLEPLRKALLMPRVGLFIADDVGLGKTIEAGLILREMLMRQKVRRVVISCPPSVVRQWQEEMESRFGLTFMIFDREFVAALLEILDPQRFCRGVPVRDRKLLDTVMVRRLKLDLREIGDDFPERQVIPIVIDDLPEDAPELKLSRLLQEYRVLREERLRDESRSKQAAAMLVITSLQKRLLSSIEAFARTLKVHHTALERQTTKRSKIRLENLPLLSESPGSDDDRAALSEEEVQAEEDAQMEAASGYATADGLTEYELKILEEMTEVANAVRYQRDPRVERLIEWIRENLCPNLGQPDAAWTEQRVLIFTEYTDTKRYLQQQLQSAIANSNRERDRIDVFHGGISEDRREEIKRAFNADPSRHPLRILIATDAAREGVNLQNHCADLFHFDVPWNPSRMEQRNGRIDRKLQRSPIVRCHYFVFPQRAEDRVLDVLVKKTATIQKELGTLSPVVQKNLTKLLDKGIRHNEIEGVTASIEQVNQLDLAATAKTKVIDEELEDSRLGKQELIQQTEQLQEMLKSSRDWLGLDDRHFRDAVSASLEILGANQLKAIDANEAAKDPTTAQWEIPALDQRLGADPTWTATLDTLRKPRQRGQKPWEWRREAPIRPVIFRDPGTLDSDAVHLHLEHRVVQRLLGRFLAQGFLHDELTRACVCLTDDPVPKVIALGRLSLYGERASRLHDEVIAVAAEWSDPINRGRKKLRPLGEGEKENVLELLENSLASPRLREVADTVRNRLKQAAAQDIEELIPHLNHRAEVLAERAKKKLTARGEKEAVEMRKILETQRDRILQRQEETKAVQLSLFPEEEQRQLSADQRYWQKRLEALAIELVQEPARIEATYQVKAIRVEPVGLMYLYPVSG